MDLFIAVWGKRERVSLFFEPTRCITIRSPQPGLKVGCLEVDYCTIVLARVEAEHGNRNCKTMEFFRESLYI